MNKMSPIFFALLAPLTAGLAVAGVSDPALFVTSTPLSSGPGSFLLLGAGLLVMYITTLRKTTLRKNEA
jgi:hypothetical protein